MVIIKIVCSPFLLCFIEVQTRPSYQETLGSLDKISNFPEFWPFSLDTCLNVINSSFCNSDVLKEGA